MYHDDGIDLSQSCAALAGRAGDNPYQEGREEDRITVEPSRNFVDDESVGYPPREPLEVDLLMSEGGMNKL